MSRKITNAASMPDNAKGSGMLPLIDPEYSTSCPYNGDKTRLILKHFSYFALYDGDGNYLFDLTENGRFEVNASSEPRWDLYHTNIFYYITANKLKFYNILERKSYLEHEFTEYTRLVPKGEADIGDNGEVMVFLGEKNGKFELFTYNLASHVKGPATDASRMGTLDSMMLAPLCDTVVTSGSNGIELWDLQWNKIRQLTPVNGHKDLTFDEFGNEIMVWCSSDDPHPVCDPSKGVGIVKVPLNGSKPECIATLPWERSAFHVSCPAISGEFFIDAYSGATPGQIFHGTLDGHLEVINQLQHVVTDDARQPKVTCSRDGTRVVWLDGTDTWMLNREVGDIPKISVPITQEQRKLTTEDVLTAAGFRPVPISENRNNEWVIQYRKVGNKLEAQIWEK